MEEDRELWSVWLVLRVAWRSEFLMDSEGALWHAKKKKKKPSDTDMNSMVYAITKLCSWLLSYTEKTECSTVSDLTANS